MTPSEERLRERMRSIFKALQSLRRTKPKFGYREIAKLARCSSGTAHRMVWKLDEHKIIRIESEPNCPLRFTILKQDV